MSTRCNVLMTDEYNGKLWFYRHSDGYPEGAGESLKRFLRWRIDGKIRENVSQASGWLVLLGAVEYQTMPASAFPQASIESWKQDGKAVEAALEAFAPSDWKCGAYEPTTAEHGDIEFLYVIDLKAKEIRCCRPGKPNSPFYVINASNIDQPIKRDYPADE